MAPSAFSTGTKTAEIGVEHTLASVNVAGVFTFEVDAANLAAGDLVRLRVYGKTLTGGAASGYIEALLGGVQPESDRKKVSIPCTTELAEENGLKFTLKQIRGTGRAFPWKVTKVG